jgi:hypothetical protein
MSDEKEYIINIITNGIESEELEMIQSYWLLRALINRLNDIEIIWLLFYLNPTMRNE